MLTVALALVVASGPEEAARVAVLPVGDGAQGGLPKRVMEALASGLSRGAVTVVDDEAVRAAAPTGCADAECVREVAKKTEARWVVRPKLLHVDRNYTIELELLDGETGDIVGRTRDDCEICGLEEVAELAADQAAVLYGEASALARGDTSIRVESEPSGARVWFDGELVGTTPLVRRTVPGQHRIRLERPGHVAEDLEVEAVTGVEKVAHLKLDPLPDDPRTKRAPLVPIGAAAIAGGIALIAGGAALVAIDGNQYKNRCSGDDVDINGTCRFSYDTLAGGATALALGVLSAGAGVAMIVVGKRRSRTQVAIGPRGVIIRGRF